MSGPSVSHRCTFCGRNPEEVERLIAGPDSVFICNFCVELCHNLLADEDLDENPDGAFEFDGLLSPREIMERLDEYVIGQQAAKRVLSVAVYNHYKRIQATGDPQDIELDKSNILMLGPTGSGKTLLAQTLARILDVPICITDATALTEAGYVGEDVENILLRLIQAADGDIARAERGIIYIDEIDKISRKSNANPSITRDVSGEGVQQALLKIVEGTLANVPPQGGRKHPHQEFLQIDTRDILFIVGGTFDGIDEAIRRRIGMKGTIGFGRQPKRSDEETAELRRHLSPEDFISHGLIPEMVGRLPVLATLQPLELEDLVRIMIEPKNALIKQYEHLLSLDNVELVFESTALRAAAELAIQRETGARGLRSIIESCLLDVMFEVPSRDDIKKVIITAAAVRGEEKPQTFATDGQAAALSDSIHPAA